MNNPNPFIPQGSLLEQKNKKRARVKLAVLATFAFNIVLVSLLLLIQACKRGDASSQTDATQTAENVDTSSNTATAMTAPVVAETNSNTVATAPMPPMTAPAPTPVAPAPSTTTYVVVPSDTYSSIAKKFNVKVSALEAANPGIAPTKLSVGKTLNIPASTTTMASTSSGAAAMADSEDVYTVKAGDNLTKIATKNGTTVKALMDMNKLSSTRINVGEKLKLPAKAATAAPSATADVMPAATTTASNPTASGAPVIR